LFRKALTCVANSEADRVACEPLSEVTRKYELASLVASCWPHGKGFDIVEEIAELERRISSDFVDGESFAVVETEAIRQRRESAKRRC